MIQVATVRALENKNGRIALDLVTEGTELQDVTLVHLGNDEYEVAVGDKLYLLPIAGAAGEFVALPVRTALRTDARIVQGSAVILADDPGNASALSLKSDTQAIVTAINNAAVLAGDGGLTFKNALIAALVGIPAGTQKVTAE